MCVVAVVLAIIALQIDEKFPTKPWWLNRGDGAQASTFLSSLLSSMITMTTLVVSITMVVLTLAASSLGPRLIRSFMGDWRTQSILGMYVAAIVYIFILLRSIDSGLSKDAVPHVAISIGSAICLGCVILLLFFVHHLGRSIIADVVIQRVGNDLDRGIERLTTPLGEEGANSDQAKVKFDNDEKPERDGAIVLISKSGYVQGIDIAKLVELCRLKKARLVLPCRPGQHVIANTKAAKFTPAESLTPEIALAVNDAILAGPEPAAANDLEFGVRLLVEIALRALSPGINDPFTAISVIDRLGVSLALLLGRNEIPAVHSDENGTARVFVPPTRFEDILEAAFNQIRQASAGKPDITIRMLKILSSLQMCSRRDVDGEALIRQGRIVRDAARRQVEEPVDLAAIEQSFSDAATRAPKG
jgi:uncharacterized membrane protein